MESPSPITNTATDEVNRPVHGNRMVGNISHSARHPGGFDSILTKQRGGIAPDTSSDPDIKKARVRHAAEQLVASALILPMLKEARNSPLDTNLIDGGQGEKAFGQKLDMILSDRIVQGSNFPIVDVITDRLTKSYSQTDKHNTSAYQTLDLAG